MINSLVTSSVGPSRGFPFAREILLPLLGHIFDNRDQKPWNAVNGVELSRAPSRVSGRPTVTLQFLFGRNRESSRIAFRTIINHAVSAVLSTPTEARETQVGGYRIRRLGSGFDEPQVDIGDALLVGALRAISVGLAMDRRAVVADPVTALHLYPPNPSHSFSRANPDFILNIDGGEPLDYYHDEVATVNYLRALGPRAYYRPREVPVRGLGLSDSPALYVDHAGIFFHGIDTDEPYRREAFTDSLDEFFSRIGAAP